MRYLKLRQKQSTRKSLYIGSLVSSERQRVNLLAFMIETEHWKNNDWKNSRFEIFCGIALAKAIIRTLSGHLFSPGPVCWKSQSLTYGRGAGAVPYTRCPSHRPDRYGGLCYKRCPRGWSRFGCCLCRRGWSLRGRGGGTVPERYCPSWRPEMDAGLCYPRCRSGYRGVSSLEHDRMRDIPN